MTEPLARTVSVRSKGADADADRLAEFGYKQELNRDWGLLQNFGASFSIISVVTGVTTLFETGLVTGGPGVMSIGWIVVSVMTMSVAFSMAEIVSAIPTSGGPYYWAAILAPPKWSACAAWVTGWFNFLGQVAVTTGISFGCAELISTLATANTGFESSPSRVIGIFAALLTSHALLNTFGTSLLKHLNNLSILLHSVGVFAIAVACLAKAPTHQSAKFVFASFYDGTGEPGWSVRASPAYVAICGILLAQYTITGYDASAHMVEETANAERNGPLGVIMSVGVSAIFGFFYLTSLLFCIQDLPTTISSPAGQPVLQIFIDIFGLKGATGLMSVVIACVWHCGLFSMTSNSRMMFAFSRDRALPAWFDFVDPKLGSPYRTVWLAAILSFILALPSLGSSVAFAAATSIATIGLYLSYGGPILCAVIWHKEFKKGPFHLGRFSRPVGIIACLWISFITIVFCLPTANPVNSQTLNYTAIAVGIIAFWCAASWILWAHKWFTGPVPQIDLAHVGGAMGHQGETEQALHDHSHRHPAEKESSSVEKK